MIPSAYDDDIDYVMIIMFKIHTLTSTAKSKKYRHTMAPPYTGTEHSTLNIHNIYE